MSWVELTQFSVEFSHVKLKIWAIRLELSWKCKQLNSISIQVQNVNLKLNLMISLLITTEYTCLTFVKIAFHVKTLKWLSISILMTWFIFIYQRCTSHCSFIVASLKLIHSILNFWFDNWVFYLYVNHHVESL